MQIKIGVLLVTIVLIFVGCVYKKTIQTSGDRKMITANQAIEISKSELKRMNALLPENNLAITTYNEDEAWSKIKSFSPVQLQGKIEKLHSNNKKYWMIECLPKEAMLGGISIVFIDRATGKMIDFYGGK